AQNSFKVGIINTLYRFFVLTTAVMPLTTLFWDVNFHWIKGNWVPYPIFLFAVAFVLIVRQKVPREFVILVFSSILYMLLALITGGEVESILRFSLAIMPLTFYFIFHDITDSNHRYFWWIYGTLLLIPLFNSYLQYTGKMVFSEFDYIDGEIVGRISGGYLKPMNLIAFTLPVYLFGFYLWKVKHQLFIGVTIVVAILVGIYIIGHRTSLIAFLAIFISSFFLSLTQRLIYTYYRYFLNFIIPILAFIAFRILLSTVGLWDKLRGRVPVWELHAWQFFDQGLFTILFGSQKVIIGNDYLDPSVVLIEEVHNNSFRTIVVFGLAGFFLYCVFMRKVVMNIKKYNYSSGFEFVLLSCFTYFIFYTVTNEPLYYASVLWPILIWIFLAQSMPLEKKAIANHGNK
ncbi:MAG: hypothetical protein RIF39_02525, partial [Cyclobacteriaceae bacterium]